MKPDSVMAGLVPAIHVLAEVLAEIKKTWIPETSPGMTRL
jgi:hypothetical protein